jgi:hypothetical protein
MIILKYIMTYHINISIVFDNEICKNLNPLLDLNINNQPYTGDIIVSNSFTDELIKYLLMSYEELSNYSGYSTPEYYKRQIIKTISLFWIKSYKKYFSN